jgi:hypothetical protein
MITPKTLVVVPCVTTSFVSVSVYMFWLSHVLDIFHMNSYHLRCLGPMATNSNHGEVYICPYCQFLEGGSICQNKGGPLVCIYIFEASFIRNFCSPSHFFSACYRDLEGSVLNYKCLLNFYLMLKISFYGNTLHY